MTHLPAPATEPRHPGGAAGAGRADALPPWHGQKVKLPIRLWGHGLYSHGAVRYAAQTIALDQRGRRCRATVATLARYMGDSKRTAERRLAELAAPAGDGITAMTVIRHTAEGGTGESAERRMHPAGRGEHFAYVPVGAAKALRPILFVLYCALAYADATGTPVTAGELGSLLGVAERSARRLVDELQTLGWITVHHRDGRQGRHTITVHEHPLHPVPDAPGPVHSDGGSGPDTDGGSLAIKEDTGLTDESTTQAGGAFRRRRDDRKWVAAPVDNPMQPVASVAGPGPSPEVPATFQSAVRPAARPAYAGPPLTLSPRVWAVLAPARDLLPGMPAFAVRRIAREIGRQLDAGVWSEDIRDQIERLRAWTPTDDIRDPGRWLLGAVLTARSRCGTPSCYWGFLAHTGAPCKACTELATSHPPHPGPARPYACTACDWTSPTPLPLHRCSACRTA